jgi:hypothetical protein
LILDFEFDQHLESHKHVINIIMEFRDTGCYSAECSNIHETVRVQQTQANQENTPGCSIHKPAGQH